MICDNSFAVTFDRELFCVHIFFEAFDFQVQDMVVNMMLICMRCDNESVVSMRQSHRQFTP